MVLWVNKLRCVHEFVLFPPKSGISPWNHRAKKEKSRRFVVALRKRESSPKPKKRATPPRASPKPKKRAEKSPKRKASPVKKTSKTAATATTKKTEKKGRSRSRRSRSRSPRRRSPKRKSPVKKGRGPPPKRRESSYSRSSSRSPSQPKRKARNEMSPKVKEKERLGTNMNSYSVFFWGGILWKFLYQQKSAKKWWARKVVYLWTPL